MPSSTTEKGRTFEEAVAELFRLMGFDTRHDETITGSQLDLLAHRTTGPLAEIYIIECKDLQERVPIDVVRQFDSSLRAARTRIPSAHGIIVARAGFTERAKSEAEALGIQTVTYDELNRKLIDLEPYAKRIISAFGADDLATEYIPLDAYEMPVLEAAARVASDTNHRPYGPTHPMLNMYGSIRKNILQRRLYGQVVRLAHIHPDAAVERAHDSEWIHLHDELDIMRLSQRIQAPASFNTIGADRSFDTANRARFPVHQLAHTWVQKAGAPGMIVLGDYGTGKTSFLRCFAAQLAAKFLDDPTTNRCPVTLPLNRFPNGMSEHALVTEVAHVVGCRNLTWNLLEHYLTSGRIVLLLDGFDEMGFQVSAQHRRAHFASILRLLNCHNTKTVVTGRPGYFPSGGELRELCDLMETPQGPKIDVVTLAPLDQRQVDSFLSAIEKKQINIKAARVKHQINTIYNLRELASRPFLLHLIIESLPILENNVGPITPARLYQAYTKQWLDREYQKGDFRWLINKDKKRQFMMVVAWEMLNNGTTFVHFSDLAEWVKTNFQLNDPESVDHFLHDIRTCSFLTRNDAGNYSFAHRSFMEYFVALRLVEETRSGRPASELLGALPKSLVSQNSVAFVVDMISENLDTGRPLLNELSSIVGGILPIIKVLERLPEEPRARLLAYVQSLPQYKERIDAPQIEKTPVAFILGKRQVPVPSQKKRNVRGKRKKAEACDFCGNHTTHDNILLSSLWGFICERCTEGAAITLLTESPPKLGSCTFCKKGDALLCNWNKTVRICRICVGVCVETAAEMRARRR